MVDWSHLSNLGGSTFSEVSALPEGSQVISDTAVILVPVQVILTLLNPSSSHLQQKLSIQFSMVFALCYVKNLLLILQTLVSWEYMCNYQESIRHIILLSTRKTKQKYFKGSGSYSVFSENSIILKQVYFLYDLVKLYHKVLWISYGPETSITLVKSSVYTKMPLMGGRR